MWELFCILVCQEGRSWLIYLEHLVRGWKKRELNSWIHFHLILFHLCVAFWVMFFLFPLEYTDFPSPFFPMCSCILGLFPVGVPPLSCLGGHWEWEHLNVENPKLGMYLLLTWYVFTPWWSLTLESCNDKSKLRGHLPYSGPSSEVSTPSSLYMEYGKWVLGRLGLQLCLCSPLVPAKLWAVWLISAMWRVHTVQPHSPIICNACARNHIALPFFFSLT